MDSAALFIACVALVAVLGVVAFITQIHREDAEVVQGMAVLEGRIDALYWDLSNLRAREADRARQIGDVETVIKESREALIALHNRVQEVAVEPDPVPELPFDEPQPSGPQRPTSPRI